MKRMEKNFIIYCWAGFSEEETREFLEKNPSDEELKMVVRERLLGGNLQPNGNGKLRQALSKNIL
jgi:hypothetical protein